jgi:Tat protein translocase TatB subunit
MPGIGITEMIILAAIALVVIGPDKFPDFAKIVIRTIRDLRGYMDEVKRDLSEELKPIEKEMREIQREDPRKYAARSYDPAKDKKKTAEVKATPPATAEGDVTKPPEQAPTHYGGGDFESDPDGQDEYWTEPGPEPLYREETAGGGEPAKDEPKAEFKSEFDGPERMDV